MTAIETVMKSIKDEATRSGDEILHLWSIDLGDGDVNVKAIIRVKTGKVITIGQSIKEPA